MSRGQHSMQGDSFRRSAGSLMFRGILLIVTVVIAGILILNLAGDEQKFESTSSPSQTTTATSDTDAAGGTTSTVVTTTVPPPVPASTTVLITNGSEVRGAARKATDQIQASGFLVATPTDAKAVATSEIYFLTGFEAMAKQVGTKLGIPTTPKAMPTPPPVNDLFGSQVLVILGPDVAQKFGTTP